MFTGISPTASGALEDQDNTDIAPNTRGPHKQSAQPAFSTVRCHLSFCACYCHEFARCLEASLGFFKYQVLHLPVTPAAPKCTQAEKLEIFWPARDISYEYSGHSCLNN